MQAQIALRFALRFALGFAFRFALVGAAAVTSSSCALEIGEGGDSPGQTLAGVGTSVGLAGLHSPHMRSEAQALEVAELFPGQGWVVDVVYSTDIDWLDISSDWIRATQHGLTPVVRIDYSREHVVWADGSPAPGRGAAIPPPGDIGWCLMRDASGRSRDGGTALNCYLLYIDDLLARSPDVHHWIIGNEVNLRESSAAFPGGISAEWYAEVYRRARQRIRGTTGHEGDTVFVAGPSPSEENDNAYVAGMPYLADLLAALPAEDVDGFALHAYGGWGRTEDNGGVAAIDVFEEGAPYIAGYRPQLRLLDELGHEGTPVLISEFNVAVHDDQSDLPEAARFIQQAYAGLLSWHQAGHHPVLGAVWFTWDHQWFPQMSLRHMNVGDTPADNPLMAFRAAAAGD